jgi:hypothetical protein
MNYSKIRLIFASLLTSAIAASLEAQTPASPAQPASPPQARARLSPGNAIWLKPRNTRVPGHEAELIGILKAHSIKHVFLWTTGYTDTRYAIFEPFIRLAHTNGLTVHGLCCTDRMVKREKQLAPDLLTKCLSGIIAYNTSHPDAAYDGVQIDIEGVSGPALLNLLKQVHVPPSLILSAAIQPNEFYTDMEASWPSLVRETDLSVLVPMLYTMDDIYYKGGTARTHLDVEHIQAKTAKTLSQLPSNGSLLVGLSGYDREYPILKSTGAVDRHFLKQQDNPDGFSETAWSPEATYGVPQLVAAGKPLVSVTYQTNSGLSIYRFDYDTNLWFDVLETTPLCLRRSMAACDQAGAGKPGYLGSCVWLYHLVFDSHSGHQDGLPPESATFPKPQAAVEVLGFHDGVARLRVSLTNANPAQRVLGAHASAGVFLRLEGASFVSADKGGFHAAEAFDGSGHLLTNVSGSQFVELRRSFFEDVDSQQAQSGEIAIAATGPFKIDYRSWMTSKESLCGDGGTSQPYVARSPDDIHYEDPAKFAGYATFSTSVEPR